MPAGVVLDTSFLITLAGKDRPHYNHARRYWKYFIENGIPMFLSTIVASEFYLRQEIPPDMLRSCVVLPFNWDHALFAARLDWSRTRPPEGERDALKDDVKIISQASVAEAEYVITDDSASFFRYCAMFREAGKIAFKAIKLEDGFDSAFFDANGQRELTDLEDEEDQ